MGKIKPEDFSLILIIGMTGMFVLAVAIILFVLVYKRKIIESQLEHQQQLIQTAVEIQEEERKRFAADLHDEIGGGISTILLSVSGLEPFFKTTDNKCSKIDIIRSQLNNLLDGIREISHNITPSNLENYGLIAALSDLCYQIQDTGAIEVNFEYEESDIRLHLSKELAIYRICKELLSNTIKHAKASQITISIQCLEHIFRLKYHDNGKGYRNDQFVKGNGMKNMKNRSKILNAEFTMESVTDKGMNAILILKP